MTASVPGATAPGAAAAEPGAAPATGLRVVAAVDLGATSGRVMIGRVGDGTVQLEEVARFPNGPIERAVRASR